MLFAQLITLYICQLLFSSFCVTELRRSGNYIYLLLNSSPSAAQPHSFTAHAQRCMHTPTRTRVALINPCTAHAPLTLTMYTYTTYLCSTMHCACQDATCQLHSSNSTRTTMHARNGMYTRCTHQPVYRTRIPLSNQLHIIQRIYVQHCIRTVKMQPGNCSMLCNLLPAPTCNHGPCTSTLRAYSWLPQLHPGISQLL